MAGDISLVLMNSYDDFGSFTLFNPFMHNVVKWPNGVNTARFLKYVWPFYSIIHERVKPILSQYSVSIPPENVRKPEVF